MSYITVEPRYNKPPYNEVGFSIEIEVASRFEKSNQLYQKEAFTPLLLEASGGLYSLKISRFRCPKMRFPVFRALN